jgi:hypothetical protein
LKNNIVEEFIEENRESPTVCLFASSAERYKFVVDRLLRRRIIYNDGHRLSALIVFVQGRRYLNEFIEEMLKYPE